MNQPNIVFIHTDQQHHLAISAYGNRDVSTPNMDRLIAEGISFRRSYSANPVCCPARASWYTGRMSVEHGVISNPFPIDPNLPDLGQWLTKHTDYNCVYSGKWHVTGRNVANSFDVIYDRHPYGELQDSGSARAAAQYIAEHANDDRPFFLSVGLLNPHDCCYVCGVSGPDGKIRPGASVTRSARFTRQLRNQSHAAKPEAPGRPLVGNRLAILHLSVLPNGRNR